MRLARKGRGGDGEGVRGELGGGRERDGWLSAGEKRRLLPEETGAAGRRRTSSESRPGAPLAALPAGKNGKGGSGASLEGGPRLGAVPPGMASDEAAGMGRSGRRKCALGP